MVITIIVLLILAGVTLNMVIGENGMFGKANTASENTKIANAKEIIRLAVLENEVYKKTGDSKGKSDIDLQTEIETKLTNEGYNVKEGKIIIGKAEPIDIAEEITKASSGGNGGTPGGETAGKEDKSKNRTLAGTTEGYSYKNPVIPQGFKAVNVGNAEWSYKEKDEVKGWNEGLVIEDDIGNQFVWVPVDGSSVPYAKWCTLGWNGVTYSNCSDDTSAIPVTENTQIDTYHGFYVARFEAGLTTTTTSQSASTNNNISTTAVSMQGAKIWNYIDYNNANTVAKAMISNSNTYGNNKSGLVTGKQWDTIMMWYQNSGIKVDATQNWGTYRNLTYSENGKYFKYTSSGEDANWSEGSFTRTGNSNSNSYPYYYHASGLNQDGIKKNIADIGGNVWEWTAEIYSSSRVSRGGNAVDSTTECPVSYRYYPMPGNTYCSVGFRVVLYVQ